MFVIKRIYSCFVLGHLITINPVLVPPVKFCGKDAVLVRLFELLLVTSCCWCYRPIPSLLLIRRNCYSHSSCCFLLSSVGAVALLSRMTSMLLSRSSCFVLNISSKSFPKYGPWAFCYQIHTRPDDPEKLGQLRSGILQIKSKLIAIAEGRYFSHLTDFFSRRNH